MFLTETARFARNLVAVSGVFLLAACQTTGMTDASGRGIQVSEWKTVDISEVNVDLPLLVPNKVTKAEYQQRDNRISHYRMQIENGKGVIFTQYVTGGWFGEQTERNAKDIDKFKAEASQAFAKTVTGLGEIRQIDRKRKKALGFAGVVNVNDPRKGKCVYAKVGYRMKGSTIYDDDVGNVDTFVELLYCDPAVDFEDYVTALEKTEFVKDHATFKAALATKWP